MAAIVPVPQVMTELSQPKMKAELLKALPKGAGPDDVERGLRIVRSLLQTRTDLSRCKPLSVVAAVVECFQLGLEPGGLQQAYFLPFKDHCQLIVGYRGFMELARRSGDIATFSAAAIREGDDFDYSLGTEPFLKHVPKRDGEGKVIGAWAAAQHKSGAWTFKVIWGREIEDAKARSPAGERGAWGTDYAAMAIKTAIRRLEPLLPQCVQLQRAATLQDQAEAGQRQVFAQVFDNGVLAGSAALPKPARPTEDPKDLQGRIDRRRRLNETMPPPADTPPAERPATTQQSIDLRRAQEMQTEIRGLAKSLLPEQADEVLAGQCGITSWGQLLKITDLIELEAIKAAFLRITAPQPPPAAAETAEAPPARSEPDEYPFVEFDQIKYREKGSTFSTAATFVEHACRKVQVKGQAATVTDIWLQKGGEKIRFGYWGDWQQVAGLQKGAKIEVEAAELSRFYRDAPQPTLRRFFVATAKAAPVAAEEGGAEDLF